MPKPLNLADFDFQVPSELVAHAPLEQRDSSRLLVRRADGSITHEFMRNLPALLPKGSLLILNDSRVLASRLLGQLPTGGAVELLLLEPTGEASTWRAIGRPMKKLHEGTIIDFKHGLSATILAKSPHIDDDIPQVTVRFSLNDAAMNQWLSHYGYIPLPPYIKREDPLPAGQSPDTARYQTVYADEQGSVAAPTAGLHFTNELLARLDRARIERATVTLHVGGGTFLPVRSSSIEGYIMHSERYLIPQSTIRSIVQAKQECRPVIVVGTTALRCLEALAQSCDRDEQRMLASCDQWRKTSIFIYPKSDEERYAPWSADALITNFHQPQSTLLMLVSALIGHESTKRLYHTAIAERYRLFSYGDTSLLWLRELPAL